MTLGEVLSTGASIIVSLGGAGFIILGFSSWLGKVWAERLMQNQRLSNEQKLAELRANLERQNQLDIQRLKTELSLLQHRELTSHQEKINIYKIAIDMFSDFLFDLQTLFESPQNHTLLNEKLISFERMRMKTYAILCIHASQDVIDAHENLVEIIIYTLEGKKQFNWEEIRGACMSLLNGARKDLGIMGDNIQYRGTR
jgi:hypothetical protein